jgi:adenylate kinase family enzyme
MNPSDLKRVVVVGTTGAGKTTVAKALAGRLGVPHVEMDALHWGPDWTPVPQDVFRERVGRTVARDAWVLDGNYSAVRQLVWDRADTVIWLDYRLVTIFRQLLGRTFGRVFRHEVLWSGNQESFWRTLLSWDSILLWALRTYHRRRRTYSVLMGDPRFSHIRFVRLRSPHEMEAWLANLAKV